MSPVNTQDVVEPLYKNDPDGSVQPDVGQNPGPFATNGNSVMVAPARSTKNDKPTYVVKNAWDPEYS